MIITWALLASIVSTRPNSSADGSASSALMKQYPPRDVTMDLELDPSHTKYAGCDQR